MTTLFTKPAKIKLAGKSYALGTLEQMLAIEGEMLARPSFVWLLACSSEKAVCTQGAPCLCCAQRRRDKKVASGEHVRLLDRGAFIERLRAYESAVLA